MCCIRGARLVNRATNRNSINRITDKDLITMSDFNPELLLDVTSDAAMSTKENLVPEGEYEGTIKGLKGRQTSSDKGTYNWLDVTVEIDGNQRTATGQLISEIINRPSTQMRYSIGLDLTDTGTLDVGQGRNVALGRLREAVGLNQPGVPFKMRDLEGRRARFLVKHRFDKDDPSKEYVDIRSAKSL